MHVIKKQERPVQPVDIPDASGVSMTVLIGKEDGAPNFTMRLFQVEAGGHSPYHTHNYEHVVYIIQGEGETRHAGGTTLFKAGDSVLVIPNEEHQFHNTGAVPLIFTCTIPNQ